MHIRHCADQSWRRPDSSGASGPWESGPPCCGCRVEQCQPGNILPTSFLLGAQVPWPSSCSAEGTRRPCGQLCHPIRGSLCSSSESHQGATWNPLRVFKACWRLSVSFFDCPSLYVDIKHRIILYQHADTTRCVHMEAGALLLGQRYWCS